MQTAASVGGGNKIQKSVKIALMWNADLQHETPVPVRDDCFFLNFVAVFIFCAQLRRIHDSLKTSFHHFICFGVFILRDMPVAHINTNIPT